MCRCVFFFPNKNDRLSLFHVSGILMARVRLVKLVFVGPSFTHETSKTVESYMATSPGSHSPYMTSHTVDASSSPMHRTRGWQSTQYQTYIRSNPDRSAGSTQKSNKKRFAWQNGWCLEIRLVGTSSSWFYYLHTGRPSRKQAVVANNVQLLINTS